MPKTRNPDAPEFKRQMVELVGTGRTPEELGREFEPSAQSIRNWVTQADRDEGRRKDGLTSAERQELAKLRRDNRRLREEREILARAAAWFARGTYGVPRIHLDLANAGLRVGLRRVARLMRAAGLQGVSRRKKIRTTRRGPDSRPASDLVDREIPGETACCVGGRDGKTTKPPEFPSGQDPSRGQGLAGHQ